MIQFISMGWLFFLLFCSLFGTDRHFLPKEGDAKLIVYSDVPKKDSSNPVLLLISGSQKQSSLRLHEAVREEALLLGFCPVTLEKRGIDGEKIDDTVFEEHLCFEERIKDLLYLYQNLKTLVPSWNGKFSILGQGDGGRIGVRFATHISNIEGIALVASGGGWEPMDEVLYSFRSEMADGGYPPQYIHGFIVQARQEFSRASLSAKVDQKAFGYTHKYWESFLKTHLAKDLAKLDCPIYSIHGVLDNRVPIESVESLSKQFGGQMFLIRKEGAGRELLQDPEIYQEAISLLSERFHPPGHAIQ